VVKRAVLFDDDDNVPDLLDLREQDTGRWGKRRGRSLPPPGRLWSGAGCRCLRRLDAWIRASCPVSPFPAGCLARRLRLLLHSFHHTATPRTDDERSDGDKVETSIFTEREKGAGASTAIAERITSEDDVRRRMPPIPSVAWLKRTWRLCVGRRLTPSSVTPRRVNDVEFHDLYSFRIRQPRILICPL